MRWLLLAPMLVLTTACDAPWSTPTSAEPSVHSDEASLHFPEVCPDRLPLGEDPDGYGFGIEEPATVVPSLLVPEEAWICEYGPADSPTGAKTRYSWLLRGDASPVEADRLPALQRAVAGLEPADRSGGCTADLGPRWMVVYRHGGDLTGVVVDDYGCRDVRLTDEPFTSPPGDGDENGMVSGVLDGGSDVLAAVHVGRER